MTALSHPRAPDLGGLPWFYGLARASLWLLFVACTLGACLVAEPPTYENPQRTPPMIDLTQTFPVVTQITTLYSRDLQEFTVAVRSEDQGTNLVGFLILDYTLEGEIPLGTNELPASTFEELRGLRVPWRVQDNLRGCHQVTMLITHTDNLTYINNKTTPISKADVALAVWWVHINPDETDPEAAFGPCPKLATLQ
jgi:hypothetical protein